MKPQITLIIIGVGDLEWSVARGSGLASCLCRLRGTSKRQDL